jgi:hypothetical protein
MTASCPTSDSVHANTNLSPSPAFQIVMSSAQTMDHFCATSAVSEDVSVHRRTSCNALALACKEELGIDFRDLAPKGFAITVRSANSNTQQPEGFRVKSRADDYGTIRQSLRSKHCRGICRHGHETPTHPSIPIFCFSVRTTRLNRTLTTTARRAQAVPDGCCLADTNTALLRLFVVEAPY